MADILCPSCGKSNPDFLDVCQFCQTPLTPDSMVHIGESPTRKNTGELEPILPEWLRDVRKQARDSAEDDAAKSAALPQSQRNEAPDLLAGLTSQSGDEEDEIPDWLVSINPTEKPETSEPALSEASIDFFAQFNKSDSTPEQSPQVNEPATEELPSLSGGPSSQEPPETKDELSEWLKSTSGTPSEPFTFEPDASTDDADWMRNLGAPESAPQPAPEEKEDLSWLHDLEASAKQAETSSQPRQDASWNFESPSIPSSSASKDDLSWLNNLGGTSEPAPPVTPPASQQEDLSWLDGLGGTSEPAQPATPAASQQEDLSWLDSLSGTSGPAQPATPAASQQEDLSWLNNLGGTSEPVQPATPPPSRSDDLGWLKESGETTEPTQASTPQDDLGWLNALGGTAEPAQPAPTPSSSQGGLDWLDKLGETSTPEQSEPLQTAPQDDLDWLKKFATSAETPQLEPEDAQNLDWLNALGNVPESSQPVPEEPASLQGGLDWFVDLGEVPASSTPASAKPFGTTDELRLPSEPEGEQGESYVSPFVPRRTAPLNEDNLNDEMPDWLKSATEETPVLPLGASALEQFRDRPQKPADEGTLPPTPEPESVGSEVFSTPAESQALSNQELDSLFSMEMPDWLSKPETGTADVSTGLPAQPAVDDSLSPVELPSWVQAMRPVEAVLSETASIETQPTEKEGPLAGLRGVIPSAPIGSSRRPKAISLKLMATDEQQAGASLFDQILADESTPRAVPSLTAVTSQNVLRWVITGILFVVLGAIVVMRSQFMPVSAVMPADLGAASNAIAAIPDDSSVLVVVDYEPSLAGEMEAMSAPVLNQLILARQPRLVFLSTSPTGVGLIERLLATARVSAPNLGYLPGGRAGIAGFIAQPSSVIPSVAVQSFSEYAAVIVLTDHAESGRSWVEQLDVARQADPSLATQSLILVTSAQAGPLLQPYVSSKQAAGMVNGLADAARFEYANNLPIETRIARNYWDAFGIGILIAVILILIGSAWSLVMLIRARRASGEQG